MMPRCAGVFAICVLDGKTTVCYMSSNLNSIKRSYALSVELLGVPSNIATRLILTGYML